MHETLVIWIEGFMVETIIEQNLINSIKSFICLTPTQTLIYWYAKKVTCYSNFWILICDPKFML